MPFVSRLSDLGGAGVVLEAILASLAGILLLIGFIILRRWYRARYFRRLNRRTFALRSVWNDLISGRFPAQKWRANRFDCQIVETMLLDSIEVASDQQLLPLLHCLRSSGLLDVRIYEARHSIGLKQRSALVMLGRTRAPEAVPALAEALTSNSRETRIAALRGLGRIGVVEAAAPILEHLLAGELDVPEHTLKNALAATCRSQPRFLMKYLSQSSGHTREVLARVLGELACPDMGDELLMLAADPLPEVRASAARALAGLNDPVALSALAALAGDGEWFVRLRAVVALASSHHHGRIRPLLRALCDPNRHVRQRAAWALAQIEPYLNSILRQVVETKDNYALQALVSELERSGAMDKVVEALQPGCDRAPAQAAFLSALQAARLCVEEALPARASVAAAAVAAGAR